MNRLGQEISTLKNRLEEIECSLILSNASNNEVARNEEQMEHRLSNLEELCEGMEKMVTCLQEDVGLIREYLNNAITRINDLHRCIDEANKDLWCSETMGSSDDDDGEFDLDDYNEKISLEAVKLQQTEDNDCINK